MDRIKNKEISINSSDIILITKRKINEENDFEYVWVPVHNNSKGTKELIN